jgi:hybrid cluster-associated redox disulfide protein
MSDDHSYTEIKLKKGEVIEITKNMIIGDVIKAYPETLEVMSGMGIHCVGCHGAAFETIAEGAFIHGIDADNLCKKINQKIKKTRKKK